MTNSALHEAEREARDEAAPIVVLVAVVLIALALVSMHANWRLFHGVGWWLWLLAAVPYLALAAVLVAGPTRVRDSAHRRRMVQALLVVIVVCSLVQMSMLVASLLASSSLGISGPQLLGSGVTLWFSNVVAFGLAFWELDCGGPVRRALSATRSAPDIQFPQDDNPSLARPGWAPHLLDYLYVSTTNSIAFSPTDAMPLTLPTKGLMAIESAVSVVTVLLIAARAVNILHV